MNFKQWRDNGQYDHLSQFHAWLGALREAAEICRGIDDLGEWGEAAGRCADALFEKIKNEERQFNAHLWDHERSDAADDSGGKK